MQRRSFLRGLAASAGATALPVPLAAKPVAAVSAPGLAAFHYGWACVYAQMNDGIAPAEIAEKFRISTSQANALFDRMLDRGVLHPPGLDGRSHATRPWQPWDKRAAAKAAEDRKAKQQEQANSERLMTAYQAMVASVSAATASPFATT